MPGRVLEVPVGDADRDVTDPAVGGTDRLMTRQFPVPVWPALANR
jgi:hypothetical protein